MSRDWAGAPRRRAKGAAAALWIAASPLLQACAAVPAMRGEIDGLGKIVEQAERNGALRCAPRQLALAKAHLAFATMELDQGFAPRAKEHLDIGEANARAAFDLSPPQRCAERGFIEDAPPPKPGDRDGDGFLDPNDECPDEPENFQGFEDEDGCPDDPDTDGDGVADSADACVLQPEDKDGYVDEDGCPEPDNDLDGIADAKDKDDTGKSCANEPEDPDGYEDQDGCPEPDNDRDQVADIDDPCPNEPGPKTGEKPGCPKKSLVIVTDKEIKITQQIHFDFDRATIKRDSFPILDAVVEVLEQNPKIRIEIQGHTDNRGAPAYNKKLSDKRAASVMKYLIAKGIDPSRLTSIGYGMERPIVKNDTEANRALNRRVQFVRVEGRTP